MLMNSSKFTAIDTNSMPWEERFMPDWEDKRWQEQFVSRLRERFPKANIELVTEAWGGRNTGSYLSEPTGSSHHYQERVLGAKPDLVISEVTIQVA